MNLHPRYVKSELKSVQLKPEREKPSRWSFEKILREHSGLKQFYPEIDPYSEAYKTRDNTWCIFSDGHGIGNMWSYLIEGPEKALFIDTAFGLGNMKALAQKLIGSDKEILCANTHFHLDHVGGNYWFDKVYIHEYDAKLLKSQMYPEFIPNAIFDENGYPKTTWCEKEDLPPFKEYEIITLKDGDIIDLGQGYEVELVHFPGHSAGQSGFFDHQTGCFFIGDTTSAFRSDPDHPEMCTVEATNIALRKLQPRFEQISGVYPGHGTYDMHPVVLQYMLETTDRILAHPERYDGVTKFGNRGQLYAKFIYQWGSDYKYSMEAVYMDPEKVGGAK